MAIKLRVWWIPQIGAVTTPFHMEVFSLAEGRRLLDALANYDLYQLEHKIKPDFFNAGGLEVLYNGGREWEEWTTDDGDDINGLDVRTCGLWDLKLAGW